MLANENSATKKGGGMLVAGRGIVNACFVYPTAIGYNGIVDTAPTLLSFAMTLQPIAHEP